MFVKIIELTMSLTKPHQRMLLSLVQGLNPRTYQSVLKTPDRRGELNYRKEALKTLMEKEVIKQLNEETFMLSPFLFPSHPRYKDLLEDLWRRLR